MRAAQVAQEALAGSNSRQAAKKRAACSGWLRVYAAYPRLYWTVAACLASALPGAAGAARKYAAQASSACRQKPTSV